MNIEDEKKATKLYSANISTRKKPGKIRLNGSVVSYMCVMVGYCCARCTVKQNNEDSQIKTRGAQGHKNTM